MNYDNSVSMRMFYVSWHCENMRYNCAHCGYSGWIIIKYLKLLVRNLKIHSVESYIPGGLQRASARVERVAGAGAACKHRQLARSARPSAAARAARAARAFPIDLCTTPTTTYDCDAISHYSP